MGDVDKIDVTIAINLNFSQFLSNTLPFQCLPEQHSVRHVLDDSLIGRAVLESDGVADLLPEQAAKLLRHALRHRHGRHPARLSAADLACVKIISSSSSSVFRSM